MADPGEPPIDIFEGHYDHPYIVDLFDMQPLYGKSGFEAELKAIDSYVLGQIESQGLKKTKDSYSSIVGQIESQLEIDSNLDYPKRIDKVSTYVRLLQQEESIKRMKASITHA